MADQKKAEFVDIPSVMETFADSMHGFVFDGTSVRVELCATRLSESDPPNPPSPKKYPTSRLVLTPQVAMDLLNKLHNLATVLEQKGLVKRGQHEPPNPQSIQ